MRRSVSSSPTWWFTSGSAQRKVADRLLIETGSVLLLETGDALLLETADPDAEQAAAVAEMTTMQAAHLAAADRYWQGVSSYTTVAGGEAQNWTDKGLTCINQTVTHVCDVYDGPLGKGWALTTTKVVGGVSSKKVSGVGPETWRIHDWQ